MVWFVVWSVLVISTLAGAFFLGRDLWRKASALGKELSRAAMVLDELSANVSALEAAAAEHDAMQGRRDPFADPVAARTTRAAHRRRADRRRQEREERHLATVERWRQVSR